MSRFGGKQFITSGIVHDADHQFALAFHTDRHGIDRKSMGKVRSAVQGINDPSVTRRNARIEAAFFCERPMRGKMAVDVIDDALFSRTVRIGNEIYRILQLDSESSLGVVLQHAARSFCGIYCDRKEMIGRHKCIISMCHAVMIACCSTSPLVHACMQAIFFLHSIDLS